MFNFMNIDEIEFYLHIPQFKIPNKIKEEISRINNKRNKTAEKEKTIYTFFRDDDINNYC